MENVSFFSVFVDYINVKFYNGLVVVVFYFEGVCECLSGLIEDEGFVEIIVIKDVKVIGKFGFYLVVWVLESGFEVSGLMVIFEEDVLGDWLICVFKKWCKVENFLIEM